MAPKHKTTLSAAKAVTRSSHKVQDSQPLAKMTRAAMSTVTLTRTIHQQVPSQVGQSGSVTAYMAQQMKKPAKNNKVPSTRSTSVGGSASCFSGSTVHPTGAQPPNFPSSSPGMGQSTAQPPTLSGAHGVPPSLGFF